MSDGDHPAARQALRLTFRRERETKNTIRYEEVVSDSPPVVGTLYIQRWALHRLGEPEIITVSVSTAPG